MQGVQEGPQRLGRHGRRVRVDRLLEDRGVVEQLDQRLLQEGAAQEVGRLRVAEASRVLLAPGQKLLDGPRRLRHQRAVVDEDHLRHAPGRFEIIDRHGEVDPRGRLVVQIDQRIVGQRLGPGIQQQPLALHGREVLAIDPDEIDAAAAVLAGGLLGQNAAHGVRGIGELHMLQFDAVALLHHSARPGDVGVDAVVPAPGVPVDRLALGLGDDLLPALIRGLRAKRRGDQQRNQRQRRCQNGECATEHGGFSSWNAL